tara:strand:- start:42 stop:3011 length:2970 start_codon:yes stop_codon:yes gene_type:complete
MGSRGVWSLGNVEKKYPEGSWVDYQNVYLNRLDTSAFGVFPSADGALKKLNTGLGLVTAVGSPLGDSSRYKRNAAGGGSRTKTYWAGGNDAESYIARLDYSTETSVESVTNLPWSNKTDSMGVASKLTDVYYVGGNNPGQKSSSGKLTFATETCAALPSSNYYLEDYYMAAITGGSLYPYAYFSGGSRTSTLSNLVKLTYSNETFSFCPASIQYIDDPYSSGDGLVQIVGGKLGTTSHGYFVGGRVRNSTPSWVKVSSLAKVTYSGETISRVPSGSLPYATWDGMSATTESDKGIYHGGTDNTPATHTNTNLLTFSNDSWSNAPSMNIPAPSNFNLANIGTSSRDSQYPVTVTPNLDDKERWFDSASTTDNNAYFNSRDSEPSPASWMHQKVNMATDTGMNVPLGIHAGDSSWASTGTSNVKGYVVGGETPGTISKRVSRLTYSTQSHEYVPGAEMPDTKEKSIGVSNQENSWFAGNNEGISSSWQSSTDKLSHSTETSQTLPSSADIISGGKGAGMGNQTLGYICPNANDNSSISKLTYATDTTSAALNATTERTQATFGGESDTACYWIGGYGASGYSADKWTFATETATLIPNGINGTGLYYGTKNSMGSGKNIFGYLTGQSDKSYVQKFNYAVDTQIGIFNLASSVETEGNWGLSARRFLNHSNNIVEPPETITKSNYLQRSIGSVPNTGYLGGGETGAGSPISSINKFNFSNETTSTIPAKLVERRRATGGTSSITHGYFSGGQRNSPFYSYTDRIVYSNDTAARIPSANLYWSQSYLLGSGTRSYGILAAGYPSRSNVQKLTFDSDTISYSNILSERRWYGAVVTEPETAGYFMNGTTIPGSWTNSVEKYTFSTSTASTYPASSPRATGYQSGMGSVTAGYVTGGTPGGAYSDVSKLTYSTSTWSTLSSKMSAGKYEAAGLNNTIFGVFCAGLPSNSRTEKVTFATETVARIPGADWADSWGQLGTGAGAQMNSAYQSTPNLI